MAAIGKNMSDEKRARLEAIRAAKAGGAAPVAAQTAVAEDGAAATEDAPVAAVAQAAPAAVAPGGLPFSADNLLGGVPANTAMAEDKIDRLKSIRSGNLAKHE